jgi:hypothetical protein
MKHRRVCFLRYELSQSSRPTADSHRPTPTRPNDVLNRPESGASVKQNRHRVSTELPIQESEKSVRCYPKSCTAIANRLDRVRSVSSQHGTPAQHCTRQSPNRPRRTTANKLMHIYVLFIRGRREVIEKEFHIHEWKSWRRGFGGRSASVFSIATDTWGFHGR